MSIDISSSSSAIGTATDGYAFARRLDPGYSTATAMFVPPRKPTTRLYVAPDSDIYLLGFGETPNTWYRFWQRVLLGFRWTRLV